jgi:hypothetical protein
LKICRILDRSFWRRFDFPWKTLKMPDRSVRKPWRDGCQARTVEFTGPREHHGSDQRTVCPTRRHCICIENGSVCGRLASIGTNCSEDCSGSCRSNIICARELPYCRRPWRRHYDLG